MPGSAPAQANKAAASAPLHTDMCLPETTPAGATAVELTVTGVSDTLPSASHVSTEPWP
jgi:hypothetical protein